jgi:ArsR family transcriptional regulator
MVQQVLSRLSRDDDQLVVDFARMEIVKKERARRAADYLRSHADNGKLMPAAISDNAAINHAIISVLDTDRLGDMLDIGTGTGRILKLLGSYSSSAVGIDTSPQMLAIARSNLHAAGLGRVMVRRGDMYGLPFPDDSFDTVTVDQVLCLADEPTRAVCEAERVLRPDGQMLIVELTQQADGNPGYPGISNEKLQCWLESARLHCVEQTQVNNHSDSVLISVAVPGRRLGIAAA